MLGLMVAYSCGPSQIFGLYAIPRGTYDYLTCEKEKKLGAWNNLKFNALCTIPVVGTLVAMEYTKEDTKREKEDIENREREARENREREDREKGKKNDNGLESFRPSDI